MTTPDPTFTNDSETTTYVARRIVMQLDPTDQMTLGRLQQFIDFSLASGATSDEQVLIDAFRASVVRSGSVSTVSTPAS